jgi:hypothetical protein
MQKTISAEMGRRAGSAGSAAAMSRRLFRVGDRVRVRATVLDDWFGTATVSADQMRDDPIVDFKKDDPASGTYGTGVAHWVRLELLAPVDDQVSSPAPRAGRHGALG